MEKRSCERIPVSLEANFYCDNTECRGTVTNLSETGMFINTKIEFPFDLNFELHLRLNGKILKTPVKISRIERTDNTYGGIGVRLLNPPENYLKFLDRLRCGKEE
ncbi:MAG: PilZ domain-containing protein [Deferribacteres bacterium]|nr:PilZ domain-containing protein [Deferribacteres bacterium]